MFLGVVKSISHSCVIQLRNQCNILWVDGDIHSKNGGKTTSGARFPPFLFTHDATFVRFWSGYLHQPKIYYNESLSFDFDAFKR